ncbi:CRISPR-associated helicase Cas3 [Leptospira kirschneri str. 200801774]|uniref:CRISPR-associated helicase/endonuclease Cas3 n=1 Tax=Leptospira kirschneri TaxID=29507 RepID=UPI0002BDFC40|nr:CRISPR-associated helicase/endonuclease Cas3 [Leptospira kirschneri]EMO78641.1 CRISPR-associated helicase Cas3 [Leptospira kirschneri str. 200801774]
MEKLLAKSRTQDGREISLQEHSFDTENAAISIFRKESRFLNNWLRFFKIRKEDEEKFLLNLRVTCLFHDIGKANDDFQKAVREKGFFHQGIRHEHLSAFVLHLPEIRKWLSQNKDLDIPIITSAVLCHHLKATDKNDHQYKWLTDPLRDFVILNLFHEEVKIILKKVNQFLKSDIDIPQLNYKTFSPEDENWKKTFQSGAKESGILGFRLDENRKQLHLAIKAALIVSDSASSGLVRENHLIEKWISKAIHSDEIKENEILKEIIQKRMDDKKILELHQFQKQVATKGDRVLLMAGCGMGKTLAAWNWANEVSKKQKISKVIFLYPTRGTATEGFKDYASWAPEADATLMHGTSDYELDSMFQNPDDEKSKRDFRISEADERLFAIAFWSKKFFSATADQFLSFLQNNYKGICLLPVLSECALIVDEVHSFDKAMFSSLLSFLKYFDLPILCMTATLTPKNKQSLLELDLEQYPKEEDRKELENLINLENHPRYNKTVLENAEQAKEIAIKSFREGKRVLWVLNTVDRCQKTYEELTEELQTEVHCYHSRFKLSDRKTVHENTVNAFQGSNLNSIAVTTQVCEMSLDLDADVLISEFAPVSSMVQRFGRANRHLKKGDEFRAELYLYEVVGSLKPYSSDEINAAKNFLNNLPEKDISQNLLATKLEEWSAQEYKTLPSASFIDGGYFALPSDYRDIEEFTTQAILDKDFPEVSQLLQSKKPIDPYILPVPDKRELNLRNEEHSLLPKYLKIVSRKYYNNKRGFAL